MNFTEALTFDTEQARTDVEANEQNELCDSTYPMTAYEVIDLLHIEIRRLRKVEYEHQELKHKVDLFVEQFTESGE